MSDAVAAELPADAYSYRQEEGDHVYACARCAWTVKFPRELADHPARGTVAAGAHVKKCHPVVLKKPGEAPDEERKLLESLEAAFAVAISAGVHPGDIVVAMAACYTGMARGLGLTRRQAIDVIETWWEQPRD